MCDLKSFSFSHHFGSGFKYFSAVIICKLSKILNLRLSGSDENGPASPRCGYWGNWGFFYSAPQDFVMLGVFCARFPPRREANI